jgi:CMP-N-acetylneuraminic acid synthetase
MTRECLLSQKSILGKNAAALVFDEPMLSIDTLEDFDAVEAALAAREQEEHS